MTVLIAESLNKVYSNGVHAVNDLNFTLNKGQIIGFLGKNGAGKSTSISMFIGLVSPTSGKLKIFDYDLPENLEQIKHRIGYVPQNLIFYPHLTVYENMDLFAINYEIDIRKERINEILDILKIADLKDRISKEMSGGQKRRLNLAIGLLNSPELLILDEPSAGMDPHSRNILWESIQKIAEEGVTIILTTHLIETADRLCEEIVIIDEGTIKVIDSPENLKKKYGEKEILDITWKIKPDREELKKLYKELESNFEIVSITDIGSESKIEIKDGINNLVNIVLLIEEVLGKNKILNISLHESTLEDVFITITGKELRDK